jgi:hypothetical protein
MNIHLPAILMFTRGTRFWHIATCKHLQHVNIRNTSNAGNEGTQQFEEPLKNRRLGWWPHSQHRHVDFWVKWGY